MYRHLVKNDLLLMIVLVSVSLSDLFVPYLHTYRALCFVEGPILCGVTVPCLCTASSLKPCPKVVITRFVVRFFPQSHFSSKPS